VDKRPSGQGTGNFIVLVSKKAQQTLKDKIKGLEIHKRTDSKIEIIVEVLNPILRGWINYFGKFNRSAMKGALDCVQRRLIKWAMCKYKNFRGHRRRAEEWLKQVRKREPRMFAHWALGGNL
jgi:RNA-directed DNA polymerase